ncbi:MAG: 16S rRNA (uracil(1498)-N(3))-methyltransferase [Proteobacteria bacterium]|nr:16S rRNA (uracil(1498)-N(3))-methyltransferase [Pseudomonadota bacterium]MBI3496852.1 16S rRNA (uracil(1498)-N(3))-methyltransferase [Pseudomonadota bacterium]
MQEKVKARLYVDRDLADGSAVGLGAEQAHYLRNVLRVEAGADVALFNGRDGEWRGHVDGIGKGWASVQLVVQVRPQAAESDLWLVFAPVKRTRIDFVVEKATELGVSALWPVFTRYTQMTRVNLERLKATAVEAAEQSERLTVPELLEPVALAEAIQRWPAGRRLIVCDERGGAPPMVQALDGFRPPAAMLIGPEGGFADGELDDLAKLDFVSRVGLGPRVLRADTAAIAALSIWQALVGDWRGVSSSRPR